MHKGIDLRKKDKKKSPQRGLGRSKCRYNSDHKQIISIGSHDGNHKDNDKLTNTLFRTSKVLGIQKTLDLQELYYTLYTLGKLEEHEVVFFKQLDTKIKDLDHKVF